MIVLEKEFKANYFSFNFKMLEKEWQSGSSGRVPASQTWGAKIKHQYCQKKKKKKKLVSQAKVSIQKETIKITYQWNREEIIDFTLCILNLILSKYMIKIVKASQWIDILKSL
jgi:hypothetical protein